MKFLIISFIQHYWVARFQIIRYTYLRFSGLVAFSSSCKSTSVLVVAICGELKFSVTAHLVHLARVHLDSSKRHEEHIQSVSKSVLVVALPSPACCTVRRVIDF